MSTKATSSKKEADVAKIVTKSKVKDAPAITTHISVLQDLSGDGFHLWNYKTIKILEQMGAVDTDSEGVVTPKNTAEVESLFLNIIGDKVTEVLLEQTPTMKPKLIWDFIQKKVNKVSLTAKQSALGDLMGFNYEEASMDQNHTKLLAYGRKLKIAFGNETAISINDLVLLVALYKIPEQFGAIRVNYEEKETVELGELFDSLIREESNSSATANRAKAALASTPKGSPAGKCKHGRAEEATCWKCHPELAPCCAECKAAGERYQHHKGRCPLRIAARAAAKVASASNA